MCRIVGGIDFKENTLSDYVIKSMCDTLSHGGPDSQGIYREENMVLAHRRLSILDLSESGKQPMKFGKYVISYNGEIYNFKEIRILLEKQGFIFLSNSDTEVIVKAFEYWSDGAIDKFRGMFAFALWNSETKVLLLCRDRFGVKPLYWYMKDGLFLFSSELKSFHLHPKFDKSIDLKGIPHYLAKGYFHNSDCIFKFVKKLKPGTFISIDSTGNINENIYWDINNIFSQSKIVYRSLNESIENLEDILKRSFSLRMISDVPVGVFLSGGIDSSLVTSILQKSTNKQLNTFTIGFEDKNYDESLISNKIALELGTNHETIICNEQDFKDVLPLLPYIYDEPFGDSSSIPTFLLSKNVSQSVKVALSGDGGDEFFGGYAKYKYIAEYKYILNYPVVIRSGVKQLVNLFPLHFYEKILNQSKSYSQFESKFLKLKNTIDSKDIFDLFENSSSFLTYNDLLLISNIEPYKVNRVNKLFQPDALISTMGYWDIINYLSADVLTKADRASMHNALETREPFLDPEVLEFSFSLQSNFKISEKGDTKFILKKILEKYITKDIINMPKHGFSVPIDSWMKGHLREDILHMLNDYDFFSKFNLNQKYIYKEANCFLTGKRSINPQVIWFIYSLFIWYRKWLK